MALSNSLTSVDTTTTSSNMKCDNITTAFFHHGNKELGAPLIIHREVKRLKSEEASFRRKKSYMLIKSIPTITIHDHSGYTNNNNSPEDDQRIVATSLKRRLEDDNIHMMHKGRKHHVRSQRLCNDEYIDVLQQKKLKSFEYRNVQQRQPPVSVFIATQQQQDHQPIEQLPQLPQPKQRKAVRFAQYVTVTIIRPNDDNYKTNSWYVRKDYTSFEIDCRESIIAFHKLRRIYEDRARSTSTSLTIGRCSDEIPLCQLFGDCYSVHGLDDFLSLEAKLLRSERRLVHAYNVLYHQMIYAQQQQDREVDGTSSMDPQQSVSDAYNRSLQLQQVAQLSSMESLRLAILRGSYPMC